MTTNFDDDDSMIGALRRMGFDPTLSYEVNEHGLRAYRLTLTEPSGEQLHRLARWSRDNLAFEWQDRFVGEHPLMWMKRQVLRYDVKRATVIGKRRTTWTRGVTVLRYDARKVEARWGGVALKGFVDGEYLQVDIDAPAVDVDFALDYRAKPADVVSASRSTQESSSEMRLRYDIEARRRGAFGDMLARKVEQIQRSRDALNLQTVEVDVPARRP